MTVEVYSDAEEVELSLNRRVIGVAPAGAAHRFTAHFAVAYQPGKLVATALRRGHRAESFPLHSTEDLS